MSAELTPINGRPYGVDGYRSDCRNSPFNGVITIDHTNGQSGTNANTAWFLSKTNAVNTPVHGSPANLYASKTGGTPSDFSPFGLFTGYGYAAGQSYDFQVGICDTYSTNGVSGLGVGVFVSGL